MLARCTPQSITQRCRGRGRHDGEHGRDQRVDRPERRHRLVRRGPDIGYLFALREPTLIPEICRLRRPIMVGIALFNILVYAPLLIISCERAETLSGADIPGLTTLVVMRVFLLAGFSLLAIGITAAVCHRPADGTPTPSN
ncbi:MAG: hypothetical protein AAFQ16_06570 [Pseudomonadota bacterium]